MYTLSCWVLSAVMLYWYVSTLGSEGDGVGSLYEKKMGTISSSEQVTYITMYARLHILVTRHLTTGLRVFNIQSRVQFLAFS